jgi:hypothetical protein
MLINLSLSESFFVLYKNVYIYSFQLVSTICIIVLHHVLTLGQKTRLKESGKSVV